MSIFNFENVSLSGKLEQLESLSSVSNFSELIFRVSIFSFVWSTQNHNSVFKIWKDQKFMLLLYLNLSKFKFHWQCISKFSPFLVYDRYVKRILFNNTLTLRFSW